MDEGLAVELHAALSADPEQVAVARQLLRGYLETAQSPGADPDLPVLLVSELVTNAIVHAGPPVTLRAQRSGDRLRVEVCDGVSVPPVLRPQQPAGAPPSERGRGLFLVASLADRWGWEDHESGKAVWFELEVG